MTKMPSSYTDIINLIYLNGRLIEIYTQWKKLCTKSKAAMGG